MTRSGQRVAQFRPIARVPVPLHMLTAPWAHLPRVDPRAFRSDNDELSLIAVPHPATS